MNYRSNEHSPSGSLLTESPLRDLEAIVRSRMPLISMESIEETQITRMARQIAQRQQLRAYRWSVTDGLQALDPSDQPMKPVIKSEDIGRISREALVLQKTARPGIEWVTTIPDRGPVLPCDRRMLRQALTNLLQNAADAVAMREGGGRITLLVQDLPNEARIIVGDDGIGLPKEERGRLTEPYVTHKPKGTGLGLAIVKKIMEDHGGTLILGDQPDGPGAVASLVLPRAPSIAAAGVAPGREVSGASHGA